ncbi:DUF3373 domain-containing protein [bacterium]|nr:DUF3373 domain-containing protein [bacterium]MBU1990475.1 DUF3373 domain-containing protein [bacterium]
MKKIFLALLPLLLSASSAEVQKKIESLENEINSLKIKFHKQSLEMEDNFPILEEVEKKSILDKINFSPELELRADKMNYDVGEIQGETTKIWGNPDYQPDGTYDRRSNYSKHFDPAGTIRFRLNMNAKLDEEVTFNGRMVFMHSSQTSQRLCILSRDIKTADVSSALDIDRAYFDYTPNKSSDYAFTFSFGLLPTSGGTPMQFAQNTQRKSMFPALVFDMNTYGIIGTQKFMDDTFLRAILAKAYTMRTAFYPYQCNRENIDNANVMGLYFDTKFDFFGKSLLSFGVNMLHDFKAHPYLGPDVSSSDAHVLGDIFTFGLGLDIEKFANTQTAFFIHTALSNPYANGKIDDYQIVANSTQTLADGLTQSGLIGFSEAAYAKGEMLSDKGYSFYFGTKYSFTPALNFGAEYNYGSKYWFSATQGAEDMYNKLATRGHVGEIYATWNFHKNLFAKLGFLYTKEEYTGSGWHFGEPAKKDALQDISYLSITARY